jgi:hypothetical protein
MHLYPFKYILFKIGVSYLYSFFLKKLQNEGLKYLIEVIIDGLCGARHCKLFVNFIGLNIF